MQIIQTGKVKLKKRQSILSNKSNKSKTCPAFGRDSDKWWTPVPAALRLASGGNSEELGVNQ